MALCADLVRAGHHSPWDWGYSFLKLICTESKK
jgi:hypothetical protein